MDRGTSKVWSNKRGNNGVIGREDERLEICVEWKIKQQMIEKRIIKEEVVKLLNK